MPPTGTNYEELNRALAFYDDGLPFKEVGVWTRDKLALLAYYLPAFAKLCSEKAGGWYYIDGFAANGVNQISGFPLSKGTAMLGITVEPRCTDSILIEEDKNDALVLSKRVQAAGSPSVPLVGDCNVLLPGALSRLSRRIPGICVLDPYGLELDWRTVVACREHRLGPYPFELLIYFSTPGAARSAGVQDAKLIERNESRLTRTFGDDSWKSTAEDMRRGRLKPREASRQLLNAYVERIEGLGYSTVMSRPALRESANLVYHMVFASSNKAGKSIMKDAFERAYPTQLPLRL